MPKYDVEYIGKDETGHRMYRVATATVTNVNTDDSEEDKHEYHYHCHFHKTNACWHVNEVMNARAMFEDADDKFYGGA